MLDHTAEVLENYRRMKENEIFDKQLHDKRMKTAYLKHESRKTENLISDFSQKYEGHKYFENTNSNNV